MLARQGASCGDGCGAGATVWLATLPSSGILLAEWVEKAAGKRPSVMAPSQAPALAKVRVNAFRQPGTGRYIVHFVNYNVPLGVEAAPPQIIGPVEITLRLPSPGEKTKVTCYDAEAEVTELPAKWDGQTLRFTLPAIRIHKIIEIGQTQ